MSAEGSGVRHTTTIYYLADREHLRTCSSQFSADDAEDRGLPLFKSYADYATLSAERANAIASAHDATLRAQRLHEEKETLSAERDGLRNMLATSEAFHADALKEKEALSAERDQYKNEVMRLSAVLAGRKEALSARVAQLTEALHNLVAANEKHGIDALLDVAAAMPRARAALRGEKP